MTKLMRAYQLVRPGLAEIVEIPVPEPAPGQIRLRTAGAGLCHSDLGVIHADPPYFDLPTTLGHEATGWIEKLGADVRGLNVGDAYGVYFPWGCGHCLPCAYGDENICYHSAVTPGFGSGCNGGMAEYFIVDNPRHLVPLGNLDPIEAAPLMCAGITTYHSVKPELARLSPGSSAVVIGIGGLGHLAIQVIKALSATQIIAVDTQDEKLQQALDLGAHHAVLAGPEAAGRIREVTDGRGAALVIDLVGSDRTLSLAQSVLAQNGQLKIVGVGGGGLLANFFSLPREAGLSVLYAGGLTDLIEVVRLAERGVVTAEVTRIGFEDLASTYALMDSGKLRGRAVLVPGR